MDAEELGQVVAYMLQHRIVETKPLWGRTNDEERTIARLLLALAPEERRTLERMFVGMRYVFADFDALSVPALPRGARVFLIARDLGNGNPSGVLSSKVITEGMRQRSNEPIRESAAWFVHLWLVHLELIYSEKDRSPSEMQRFAEGLFDFDVLLERMRTHLEDMRRRVDRNVVPVDAIFRVFEGASHHEVERRCRHFVKLMVNGKLLAVLNKDQYQQTLLSAFEIKRNYVKGLQSFVVDANAKGHRVAASILTHIDLTGAETEV